MGYRELLKKYIRFVESQVGDDFIDAVGYVADGPFSDRELGELKALTVDRATDGAAEYARMLAFSYRFRLLCISFDLTLEQAAEMAGVDATVVRHWRANPLSTDLRGDARDRIRSVRALARRLVDAPTSRRGRTCASGRDASAQCRSAQVSGKNAIS